MADDYGGPWIPAHTKQASQAMIWLLFYSILMFTMPFLVFFGTRDVLENKFHVDGYANTVWSVIASVVTVNLIICAYAYQAYHETEYDDEGNQIDTLKKD